MSSIKRWILAISLALSCLFLGCLIVSVPATTAYANANSNANDNYGPTDDAPNASDERTAPSTGIRI